jgi:DNA-binding transcriptional MerR regulator
VQLSELSERSGVSAASIKYYLREGLLPPGATVTARKAEYDEDHLRRLRLVRALLTVGGMSVAQARDVLAAAQDPAFDRHDRLGVAQYLLPPHVTPPPEESPEGAAWRERRAEVVALLRDDLGWRIHDVAPALDALTQALITLNSLGYPTTTASLRDYANALHPIAESELRVIDEHAAIDEAIEAVVACTVLYEPVLLSLRRLAHEDVSARRRPPT